MDEFDSVDGKVNAIFRELVGQRADAIMGDKPARVANDILGHALAVDCDELGADEMAFHLVD